MPTKIGPNNTNLYSGLAFLFICPIFLIVFLCLMLPDAISGFHRAGLTWDTALIFIFPLFLVITGSRFISRFLTTPFWAAVDDNLKTMEFKCPFKKPQLIRREHIVAYEGAVVKVSTRSGTITYPGFVLQLLDGTKLMASQRGLDDILYITQMLDYWGIKKLEGEEQFSA